jgi:predicted aconitase with swiveling domain
MMLGWSESSLDYEQEFNFDGITFAGAAGADMASCAATIQSALRAARHPALYCGTGASTTLTDWTAITAGSFDIYVDGTIVHVTGVDFTSDASMADVAASIQTGMQAIGGTLAAATCVWDTTALIFVVKANNGSATATSLLSYLYPNSSGTGTDISEPMKGRETSTSVYLVRRGKGATTTGQTVAWDTTHFDITSASVGQQYRFGYLTAPSVGTDIGAAGYMNGIETATASLYTPGLTAKRSVQGDGTAWSDWCEGMRFFVDGESNEYDVGRVYGEDLVALESDYSGDAFFTWKEYTFAPYNAQVWVSNLRNPFKYDLADIVETPTADADRITAIRRNGPSVSVFMEHHVWAFDGVSIEAPKMISNVWGAPNTASCVEYGNGIAVFTGQDFIFVIGSEIRKLDPERRMKQYIDRLSSNFQDYHGVFDDSENKEFIKWFVGLDSSFKANTCIVLDPVSGNWWLHNVKDANCSAIIRNGINEKYLLTGSTYDDGHSIKAWLHRWGKDYHADGAINSSSYDHDGIIASVGTATTTAGYLTCGTAGGAYTLFSAVTAGYFSVTINDSEYDIGPVDLSTATSLGGAAPSVASLLQTAIRSESGGTETVTCPATSFIITSGTTTARSNVGYLRPYRPVATMTDLSDKGYLNGRDGHATKTYAVTQVALTCYNWSSSDATLPTASDGEEGVWVYVCDTNFRNGQYARVVSNTATIITVSPNFTTAPEAGWYWYVGGIVPSWTKWVDWGSPQHRAKVHGISITVPTSEGSTGNTLAVHQMQDLSTTIRVTKTLPLGTGQDTTQTVYPSDKIANQHGIKIMRPSSTHDLEIDDITISHRARV